MQNFNQNIIFLLKAIVFTQQLPVIDLLETNVGMNFNISYQNYSFYNCSETNGVYHGGSALTVKNSVPHKLLSIQTNLQATAARIAMFKMITVCSVYLPLLRGGTLRTYRSYIYNFPLQPF